MNIISRVREWMSTGLGRWVAVAAVLVIVGTTAATFLRDGLKSEADAVRAKGMMTRYYCTACGATGKKDIAWDEQFPLECPQCHKKEAVVAFECPRCHNAIEKKDALFYRCPHCQFPFDKRLVKPGAAGAGTGQSQNRPSGQ